MTKGVIDAPAKLNLSLRILARESSGYHQLESLFVAVDLSDRIEVRDAEGSAIRLVVDGDDGQVAPDRNLVTRAAALFRARSAAPVPGLEIALTKTVPVAAGLGGGSSDAAATLRLLAALYPAAMPSHELLLIGAELGSDVPFFLSSTPWAWAWGRGTRLLSLEPAPARHVLIAVPERGVSTAEAYGALGNRGKARSAEPYLLSLADLERWEALARNRVNDFEASLYPDRHDLRDLGRALAETGAVLSGMTGSGSAHFGVFESGAAADLAEHALRAGGPALRIYRASSLTEWPRPQLEGE